MLATLVRGAGLSFAAAAVSALAVVSLAQPAPKLAPTGPLKVPTLAYERYTLPNGLTVLLHEDHRLPLVAVDLWYHVGPVNEVQGRTGFAHLFEHMMFEGSEHVGEKAHFRYLEGAGATDINGTTDFDRTNYFETVPSNELELALWLESDRMGFLLEKLDREKLTNQRDVVRNERRQGENQPYQLSQEEVYHQLFPKEHPYYASVIGSHADIEAARLLDVRNFFHSYYTPNNANIAIAGDFDKAKLKQLIERYFGSIPKGPEPPPVTVTTPPITAQKTVTVTDTVQLPEVSFAWLMPPAFQPGDADAEMLIDILGGGKASRLYRKLVYEKQIAQSADCTLDSLRLASVAECDVIARPGIKPEDLLREIQVELRAIREQGPTQAGAGRRTQYASDRPDQRLAAAGRFRRCRRPHGLLQLLHRRSGLFVERRRALPACVGGFGAQAGGGGARRCEKRRRDHHSGREGDARCAAQPGGHRCEREGRESYPASFETAQDWRKTAPSPGPLPQVHLPVPKVFTLDNGMHVYLVEDHSLPVLNASVMTWPVAMPIPRTSLVLPALPRAMLTQGTRERSATEIAEGADQLGCDVEIASRRR